MLIQKNEVDIPNYLNHDFFRALLKSTLHADDFIIEMVTFTMGSGGGENYCSFIYRAVIDVVVNASNRKRLSVIIKSMPTDGERKVFEEIKMHKKETDMYFKMIPKLEKMLNIKLAPKCYYAQDEPIQTIVFEDLNEGGYKLADRQVGLDEEHCNVLLTKLGVAHAASLYFADKDPSIMQQYNVGIFSKRHFHFEIFQGVFVGNFKSLIKVAENWKGYEQIVKKLKNLEPEFLTRFGENGEPSPDELKVLNHGDLWVNNFMFKYKTESSKHPSDMLFIDFQGSFYSSPGIDINYFLNTSVQLDVLENRREHMLKEYYYKSFRQTLEDLDFQNIPTFDDILAEVHRKEFFGFCAAVGILALIGMDKEASKDNSIESLTDKESAEQKSLIACSTKRYQDTMRYLLKRNDKLGLFD